ncbi:MAG: M42 family peptidase [Oscillospiraceae bacterium]|jgi:endoglucanase|nr:M42 family peptidase [Oscillospiraceae bacterium]
MLDIRDTLRCLCESSGPSGYEGEAAAAAARLLAPFTERVETDRLGNVLGFLPCGEENAPVVLLDAHLDEVGVMAAANEEGYVQFRTIGGLDPRVLPAQTVKFLTDPPVYGVIACLPPHVQTADEQKKVQGVPDLYIDTGGIEVAVGTPGVFTGDGFALGENQYVSKALDDRACFAVILRALELLPATELLRGKKRRVDIAVSGSVMEEVGGYGARTAAFRTRPEYAVALDAGYGKAPDSPAESAFKMGGGPVIALGPESSRKITDKLILTAKEREIPYQLEVYPGETRTNGTDISLSRQGVATAVLSVPVKYMHTTVETLHLKDVENTARLLAEWIIGLDGAGGEDA